jgi:hypothetical protein
MPIVEGTGLLLWENESVSTKRLYRLSLQDETLRGSFLSLGVGADPNPNPGPDSVASVDELYPGWSLNDLGAISGSGIRSSRPESPMYSLGAGALENEA